MRKLIYFIAIGSISFCYSCKKCTTCNSYDSAGNVIISEVKTCGNSADIEKAKDKARNSGALLGGTFDCTDE